MKNYKIAATLFLVSTTALGAPPKAVPAVNDERVERDVDQAALDAQSRATFQLVELLKRYKGSATEPDLLGRYADALEETAAIEFRIAHGRAHRKGKPLDLTNYHRTLKRAIEAWSEEIVKFPSRPTIPEAYFGRAKSEEELGLKELAERDYELLVRKFPESRVSVSATMSLADLAIEKGEHAKAIQELSTIETRTDDPHYPLALYKIAWAYYNLRNVSRALAYLEKNISYYHQHRNLPGSTISDSALQENAFLDSAIFVFEGFEQKDSRFVLSEVFPYFVSLKPGAVLEKMALRYAKLLRTHGHREALVAWKDICLAHQNTIGEVTRKEILLTVFQDQLNQRNYAELVQTAHEMAGYGLQAPLLETADLLQKEIVKNKNADGVGVLNAAAAGIYDAFTRSVSPQDPRLAKIHYNLGESLFETKNYEAAADNYRWIGEHAKNVPVEASLLKDAGEKAIAARYEVLRVKGLIPKELEAKALVTGSSTHSGADNALQLEWMSWVDSARATAPGSVPNFYFEANRCLYSRGEVSRAVARLEDFAVHNPLSPFAIPSASLVLDTAIAGENWVLLKQKIEVFQTIAEWKGSDFSRRLSSQGADVATKIANRNYKDGHFGLALNQAEEAMKKNGERQDLMILAGDSAVAMQMPEKAAQYFTRLIESPHAGVGSSDVQAKALLARARLYESGEGSFQFQKAAADYRRYLSLSGVLAANVSSEQRSDLKKRILLLSWLSSDSALLAKMLSDPGVCIDAECDRYHALEMLSQLEHSTPSKALTEHAFSRARKGFSENFGIWAAITLSGAQHLGFRDRSLALEILGSHWKELDPLVASTLLPLVNRSVPLALELNRRSVSEIAPLIGATGRTERYIQDRMFRIHEFEAAATQAARLPWARIQALALNQTAEVYLDAAKSLQDARLAQPFEEKGQDLRGKAFEVASKAAIDGEAFDRISSSFFTDNPTQAKALKSSQPYSHPRVLDLFTMDAFGVSATPHDGELVAKKLRDAWELAVRAHEWQRVGFFLRFGAEKSILSPGLLALMQATSWAAMGAQSEGLRVLSSARAALPEKTRLNVTLYLMANYLASFSREGTQAMLEDYRKLTGKPGDKAPTSVAKLAADWMGG